ncbi:unnamed protein product [Phytophthora lilii]|uniref:Unnamed protein product n=1 Tax=Phytophthora lilii TaxID=2077276 RepID=A0A9W6TP40_9STRA|nr:unnamed protein product [Phytophthora lilii]
MQCPFGVQPLKSFRRDCCFPALHNIQVYLVGEEESTAKKLAGRLAVGETERLTKFKTHDIFIGEHVTQSAKGAAAGAKLVFELLQEETRS